MNDISVKNRITAIDLLRGLVMVIMALDHVRLFFHADALRTDPTDLATTTPFLFFTRWITHFCAPVFVFLAGTAAYLTGRTKNNGTLSIFLLKRGIWLLVVEVVIITFGWTFDPGWHHLILQVIWAIGISMILLGLIVLLPYPAILLIGLGIVLGHNLLDYPEAARNGQLSLWWELMHHRGAPAVVPVSGDHYMMIAYGFLPWAGVMILGYCFGRLFEPSLTAARRRKTLVFLGWSLITVFILLRVMNAYGDPHPWQQQSREPGAVYTFFSFINVTKYPPSLMFLCMTLGPAILCLNWVEKAENGFTRIMTIFGRVPLFYYIVHFYLIHAICVIAFFLSGYTTGDIVQVPFYFRPPADFGFGLWTVYGFWLLVVILLYPLCNWYNRYKSTHRKWWISYL